MKSEKRAVGCWHHQRLLLYGEEESVFHLLLLEHYHCCQWKQQWPRMMMRFVAIDLFHASVENVDLVCK